MNVGLADSVHQWLLSTASAGRLVQRVSGRYMYQCAVRSYGGPLSNGVFLYSTGTETIGSRS